MERDIVVRKVAQDVLMLVWYKQGLITEKPSPELSFVPEITAEFLNNLYLSVRIDSYTNEIIWKEYLKNHFNRMIASPYLFAKYVYHACYILNLGTSDAYKSFCDTLSLVAHFVLHSWQEERKEFLNTCVDLFCAFFKQEIRTKFDNQGGWQNFNAHLVENHDSLIRYKKLISANKPENEIFKEIQDDFKLSDEPFKIYGVDLVGITENQVEENKEADKFAESVASKMRDLCKQTFEEVLADFAKTDNKVEELYRQTVGEATGGIASDEEQSSLQKDQEDFDVKASEGKQSSLQKDQETFHDKASEVEQSSSQGVQEKELRDNPSSTSSKKNEDQTLDLDLNSSKSQDFGPANQELDQSPKLTNAERAKIILNGVLDDIPIMYQLIKFVCMQNSSQAVGTTKNA